MRVQIKRVQLIFIGVVIVVVVASAITISILSSQNKKLSQVSLELHRFTNTQVTSSQNLADLEAEISSNQDDISALKDQLASDEQDISTLKSQQANICQTSALNSLLFGVDSSTQYYNDLSNVMSAICGN